MSRSARFSTVPAVAAMLTGAWVVAFMTPESPLVWWAVLLTMLGMALAVRLPATGASLVLAASTLCGWLGAQYSEIEMLLPTMGVLFWLGRASRFPAVGAGFVVAFAAVTALRPEFVWYGAITSAVVYGAAWVFGRIVQARAIAARQAVAETTRLASIDIDRIVTAAAEHEQRLLRVEALGVIREALERMLAHTSVGSGPLTVEAVTALRAEGTHAIQVLHGVLARLRSGSPLPHPEAATDSTFVASQPAESPWEPGRSRRQAAGIEADMAGPLDAIPHESEGRGSRALLTVAATAVAITVAHVSAPGNPAFLVLSSVAPTCAVIAGRHPLPAGAVFSAAFLLAATQPQFAPNALFPVGACLALFVWSLVGHGSRADWISLAVVAAAAVALGAQFGRSGAGFVIALIAMAAYASYSWREQDRIRLAELTRGSRLSAQIAGARLRARAAERRAMAADLHDGVSYAITAMMLQAQASLAQASHDPARSAHALNLVHLIGTEALHEVSCEAGTAAVPRSDSALSLCSSGACA